jgi:hypothetical protein
MCAAEDVRQGCLALPDGVTVAQEILVLFV